MEKEIIFEARHINKAFGPTIALKDVSFFLRRGEIHGLIGENGSGKSTLMSIAAGMQNADSGEMYYLGSTWRPETMVQALNSGFAMILQESNTFANVTVAQNIFAGQEKKFVSSGVFRMGTMVKEAQKILNEYGITHILAGDPISKYSYEDRKLVELIRCICCDPSVLVVDETTSMLSHTGRDILYNIIHRMAEQEDKAVVFISHDMDELMQQSTIITVLRDGNIIGDIDPEKMAAAKADAEEYKRTMRTVRQMTVGRDIGEKYYREDFTPSHRDEVALELKHVSFDRIQDFSLTVHAGEIVGIGGLSSCGMHPVGWMAFGLVRKYDGDVIRNGVRISKPIDAIRQGIGYISKNRDAEALILSGSIEDNIVMPSLDGVSRHTFVSPKALDKLVSAQLDALSIKCRNKKQRVNMLSGGNKQKVSFAKWTAKDCDVYIMDCPTRGVDVKVKQFMYSLMEKMKAQGKAILMISEELNELIGMADRFVIMKNGRITKEFTRSPALKESDIIEYML